MNRRTIDFLSMSGLLIITFYLWFVMLFTVRTARGEADPAPAAEVAALVEDAASEDVAPLRF